MSFKMINIYSLKKIGFLNALLTIKIRDRERWKTRSSKKWKKLK
jgi:hypothetical protein